MPTAALCTAPVACGHACEFAGRRRPRRGDRSAEQRPGRRTTAFGARGVPRRRGGDRQVPAGGRVCLPGLRAGDAGAARAGGLHRPGRAVPSPGGGPVLPLPCRGHAEGSGTRSVPPGVGEAGAGVAEQRVGRLHGDRGRAGRGPAAAAVGPRPGHRLRGAAGGPPRLRHGDRRGRGVRHRQPGGPSGPAAGHPAPGAGDRPGPRTLRRAASHRDGGGVTRARRRGRADPDRGLPGDTARAHTRGGPAASGRTRGGKPLSGRGAARRPPRHRQAAAHGDRLGGGGPTGRHPPVAHPAQLGQPAGPHGRTGA